MNTVNAHNKTVDLLLVCGIAGALIMERVSQYGHQLWHAILALVLLYRRNDYVSAIK